MSASRHVMDSTEGAAWGFQLEAMMRVLNAVHQDARDASDQAVVRLVACVAGAREAADEIEKRPAPSRKGVRLAKS